MNICVSKFIIVDQIIAKLNVIMKISSLDLIQVRVPYRVVGLVVGPKGATIKRIQQQTRTYIVTPSRDKEPVFEVTGLPENVETARKEIEAHIAFRYLIYIFQTCELLHQILNQNILPKYAHYMKSFYFKNSTAASSWWRPCQRWRKFLWRFR